MSASPLCLCHEEWACATCCKCVNHCQCALATEPVHIKSKEFASALLRSRLRPRVPMSGGDAA